MNIHVVLPWVNFGSGTNVVRNSLQRDGTLEKNFIPVLEITVLNFFLKKLSSFKNETVYFHDRMKSLVSYPNLN